MAAIINPETIVMTGTIITEDLLAQICSLVSEIIPEKHIPHIRLENDSSKYYLKGLSSMTLEYLNNQ